MNVNSQKTSDQMNLRGKTILSLLALTLIASIALAAGCSKDNPSSANGKTVPHEQRWGIYALDLVTEDVALLYSSSRNLSELRLNEAGDWFAFCQKMDGDDDEHEEICTLGVDGSNFKRLTNNEFRDPYPAWSPDGSQIAFLSFRDTTMDIYVMDADDGGNERLLYDSGFHDCDIDWRGDKIVFTRNSQIWMMNDDGTDDHQITDPPRAGEWGNANLPFGDYDPRLNPDLSLIAFERMVDDSSPHGNYDIYVINPDGWAEDPLTDSGYSQGFASWSHSGGRIVYLVAAIGTEGRYDIYMMNSDGSENGNITPDYFPANFLCHSPVFSIDDDQVFFVGQWWE